MLTYHTGDLLDLIPRGVIIAHVCNDVGAWFSGPLGKRFPEAKKAYLDSPKSLGGVTVTADGPGKESVWVASMIAQQGLSFWGNPEPLHYEALHDCMVKVGKFAVMSLRPIWCPKFGAGLAGGDWSMIEKMIEEIWGRADVNVCVPPTTPEPSGR